MARADALETQAPPARLPWSVCAAIDGDWLIFLDLARNAYRATSVASAPSIAGLALTQASPSRASRGWKALAEQGLLAAPPRERSARVFRIEPAASWRDFASVVRAGIWARGVVRRGALLQAFLCISIAKARLPGGAFSVEDALRAYAKFAAARIWLPARFVCLFDSLCLMRFLLARRIGADLVFGVRSRPFAAHCWVECEGEVLDDGGEVCRSFVEIVRV